MNDYLPAKHLKKVHVVKTQADGQDKKIKRKYRGLIRCARAALPYSWERMLTENQVFSLQKFAKSEFRLRESLQIKTWSIFWIIFKTLSKGIAVDLICMILYIRLLFKNDYSKIGEIMSVHAYSTQNPRSGFRQDDALEEQKKVASAQVVTPQKPTIRRSPGSLDLRIQIIGLERLNSQSPKNRPISSHSSPSISRQAYDGDTPFSVSSLTPKAHPGTPSLTDEIDDDSPKSEGDLIGNPFGQLSTSQISTDISRSKSAPPEADPVPDREHLLSLSELARDRIAPETHSAN